MLPETAQTANRAQLNKSLVNTKTWQSALEPDTEVLAEADKVQKLSQTLMQGGVLAGPMRPEQDGAVGYEYFSNKHYLQGYARKILYDLIRMAKLYNGHEVRLYVVDKSRRCPQCTNLATGERLVTSCTVCHGTGYINNWKFIGQFWTYTDFGPKVNLATPYGNTENPNGTKENIILLGAPAMSDQALIIFIESREIYKIYDVAPHIVAMRGDILAQIAQASRLTPGSEEYKLINW